MYESISPGDLISYNDVSVQMLGHKYETNAQLLGKLRAENAQPQGNFKMTFYKINGL